MLDRLNDDRVLFIPFFLGFKIESASNPTLSISYDYFSMPFGIKLSFYINLTSVRYYSFIPVF